MNDVNDNPFPKIVNYYSLAQPDNQSKTDEQKGITNIIINKQNSLSNVNNDICPPLKQNISKKAHHDNKIIKCVDALFEKIPDSVIEKLEKGTRDIAESRKYSENVQDIIIDKFSQNIPTKSRSHVPKSNRVKKRKSEIESEESSDPEYDPSEDNEVKGDSLFCTLDYELNVLERNKRRKRKAAVQARKLIREAHKDTDESDNNNSDAQPQPNAIHNIHQMNYHTTSNPVFPSQFGMRPRFFLCTPTPTQQGLNINSNKQSQSINYARMVVPTQTMPSSQKQQLTTIPFPMPVCFEPTKPRMILPKPSVPIIQKLPVIPLPIPISGFKSVKPSSSKAQTNLCTSTNVLKSAQPNATLNSISKNPLNQLQTVLSTMTATRNLTSNKVVLPNILKRVNISTVNNSTTNFSNQVNNQQTSLNTNTKPKNLLKSTIQSNHANPVVIIDSDEEDDIPLVPKSTRDIEKKKEPPVTCTGNQANYRSILPKATITTFTNVPTAVTLNNNSQVVNTNDQTKVVNNINQDNSDSVPGSKGIMLKDNAVNSNIHPICSIPNTTSSTHQNDKFLSQLVQHKLISVASRNNNHNNRSENLENILKQLQSSSSSVPSLSNVPSTNSSTVTSSASSQYQCFQTSQPLDSNLNSINVVNKENFNKRLNNIRTTAVNVNQSSISPLLKMRDNLQDASKEANTVSISQEKQIQKTPIFRSTVDLGKNFRHYTFNCQTVPTVIPTEKKKMELSNTPNTNVSYVQQIPITHQVSTTQKIPLTQQNTPVQHNTNKQQTSTIQSIPIQFLTVGNYHKNLTMDIQSHTRKPEIALVKWLTNQMPPIQASNTQRIFHAQKNLKPVSSTVAIPASTSKPFVVANVTSWPSSTSSSQASATKSSNINISNGRQQNREQDNVLFLDPSTEQFYLLAKRKDDKTGEQKQYLNPVLIPRHLTGNLFLPIIPTTSNLQLSSVNDATKQRQNMTAHSTILPKLKPKLNNDTPVNTPVNTPVTTTHFNKTTISTSSIFNLSSSKQANQNAVKVSLEPSDQTRFPVSEKPIFSTSLKKIDKDVATKIVSKLNFTSDKIWSTLKAMMPKKQSSTSFNVDPVKRNDESGFSKPFPVRISSTSANRFKDINETSNSTDSLKKINKDATSSILSSCRSNSNQCSAEDRTSENGRFLLSTPSVNNPASNTPQIPDSNHNHKRDLREKKIVSMKNLHVANAKKVSSTPGHTYKNINAIHPKLSCENKSMNTAITTGVTSTITIKDCHISTAPAMNTNTEEKVNNEKSLHAKETEIQQNHSIERATTHKVVTPVITEDTEIVKPEESENVSVLLVSESKNNISVDSSQSNNAIISSLTSNVKESFSNEVSQINGSTDQQVSESSDTLSGQEHEWVDTFSDSELTETASSPGSTVAIPDFELTDTSEREGTHVSLQATDVEDHALTQPAEMTDMKSFRAQEIKGSKISPVTAVTDSNNMTQDCSEIKNRTPNKVSEMKDSIPNTVSEIKDKTPNKVSEIEDTTPNKVSEIKDTTPNTVSEIKDKTPNKVSEIEDTTPNKVSEIKDTTPNTVSEIKDKTPNKLHLRPENTVLPEVTEAIDKNSENSSSTDLTPPASTQKPTNQHHYKRNLRKRGNTDNTCTTDMDSKKSVVKVKKRKINNDLYANLMKEKCQSLGIPERMFMPRIVIVPCDIRKKIVK